MSTVSCSVPATTQTLLSHQTGFTPNPRSNCNFPPSFAKEKASAEVACCTRSTQKQQQVSTWLSPAEHPGYATNPATSFRKWSCNQCCADYTTEFQAALPDEPGTKLPAGSPGSPGCSEGPLLLSQPGSHLPAQAAPMGSPLSLCLEARERDEIDSCRHAKQVCAEPEQGDHLVAPSSQNANTKSASYKLTAPASSPRVTATLTALQSSRSWV